MQAPLRTSALRLVVVLGLAAVAAACGGPAPTTAPATGRPEASASAVSSSASGPSDATPVLTPVPQPTTVPGSSGEPAPGPGGGTTTVTDWGTILDRVPEGFPVYPGAATAELPEGPNSGAWTADAGVDVVAAWYRAALEALGFATKGLSSPLEDGSRVLDTVSDLPECRIQTTFRPAGGSTMISVLYGAGCAGGEG